MDPLRLQVYESFLETKSGDEKLDDLNANFGAHVRGILNQFEETKQRIDTKANLLTPAGREAELAKAREKVIEALKEIDAKGSFSPDIKEINKKFDVDGNATDIQTLITEGRQRETREYLRSLNAKSDLKEMEMIKLKIADGDPTIVGAIANAPYKVMDIDPAILEVGIEKMRLRTNPQAAQRLEVLTTAQDVHENLITFARQEIGAIPDAESSYSVNV